MEEVAVDHIVNNNEGHEDVLKTLNESSVDENLENCQNFEEESLKKDGTTSHKQTEGGSMSKLWDYLQPISLYIGTISALFVTYLKIFDDFAVATTYYKNKQQSYFIVTVFCLTAPSLTYAIYMTAKYAKQTLEIGNEVNASTAVIIFIKNLFLFIPLKLTCYAKVLRHQINSQKHNCSMSNDKKTNEKIKELTADARIISFFQRFFAGFPQILLQLYIVLVSQDEKIDTFTVYSQLLLSGLSTRSLVTSVNREDDGMLSIILSSIGWLSTIFSRCLFLALLTSMIGSWVVLPCFIHIMTISLYLTLLADESHIRYLNKDISKELREKMKITSFFAILTTFGFQSLIYWPLMFALNDKSRPLKYFGLVTAENTAVVIAILCFKVDLASFPKFSSVFADPDIVTVVLAVGLMLLGFLFILFYSLWKPKNTDYWKLFLDDQQGTVNLHPVTYGVYYEYFGTAFTIPVKISPHEIKEFNKQFE